MNKMTTCPDDYYGNGLVNPEEVRALAHQLSLECGDSSQEGSQPWLEAEAWLRYRKSEGSNPVWS